MLKAIETSYKGYRFRSRLEARWAVFFDALGVPWEYEAQGYELGEAGRYLPDFWLPKHDTWVEIKGEQADGWRDKADALSEASGKSVFIAVGSIGEHTWFATGNKQFQYSLEYTEHLGGLLILIKPQPDDWLTSVPGVQLHCPICGYDYVHFNAPTHQTTDNYDAWEGRGSAIRIPMYCEGGHRWTLRFGFHKGGVSLAIEGITAEDDDLGLWLANGDQETYNAAVNAARSARFEHGEHGR